MHPSNKPLESPRGTDPSKAIPALEPGHRLVGRYELVRRIGEGGMGVVWQAKQITTDKPVAIKLLRSDGTTDVARFLREAKVAAGLTHPNVVQVFDFWEAPAESSDGGLVFMVMELLVGEPLSAKLERTRPLSVAKTSALVVQIARALRASHANNVVHRDLKPDNVFLVTNPEGRTTTDEPEELVKVVDFGLAKPVLSTNKQTAMTQSGSVLGTPLYMAPEMVFGEEVDVRADIWALGVITYQCLVGRTPFEGENFGQIFRAIAQGTFRPLHEAAPHVPPWLSALVGKMLSQNRDARPSAVEVIAAFEQGGAFDAAGALAPQAAPHTWATSTVHMRTPNTAQGFVPAVQPSPPAMPMPAAIAPSAPPAYASGWPPAPAPPAPTTRPRNVVLFGIAAAGLALLVGIGLFLGGRSGEGPRPTTTIELPPAPSSTNATTPTAVSAPPESTAEEREPAPVTTPRRTSVGTPAATPSPNAVHERPRSTPDTNRTPDAPAKASTDVPGNNPLQRGRF